MSGSCSDVLYEMAQGATHGADLGGMFASAPARPARRPEPAGRLERIAAGMPLRTSFLVIVVVLGVALGGFFLRSTLRDGIVAADTNQLTALCRQVKAAGE